MKSDIYVSSEYLHTSTYIPGCQTGRQHSDNRRRLWWYIEYNAAAVRTSVREEIEQPTGTCDDWGVANMFKH